MNKRFAVESLGLVCVLAALLACKKGDSDSDDKQTSKGTQISVSGGDKDGSGSVTIETPAGKVGASSGECKPGEACTCSGIGACNKTCTGQGCKFECAAIGACNFDCPQGKCTVSGTGTGATRLSCAGGGCSMSCSGTGACTLNDCKSGCSTSCTGTGTCTCASGC